MWEEKNENALLFLDIENAFDKVNHEVLIDTLIKLGFPLKIIQIIKSLYHRNTSAVIVNNYIGKEFKLFSGTRQGCPLSPFLFIIVAKILNQFLIKHSDGISIGKHIFKVHFI